MTRTMTLLLISLGVLLALVAAESEPIRCPEDKEYTSCYAHCPPSCDKLNPPCPKICVEGCLCKSGTVENSFGECVETDKCKLCSGNTTYTACTNPCPKPNPPIICTVPCIGGCICKPDYVSLPDSDRCVLPQDLPKSGSNN